MGSRLSANPSPSLLRRPPVHDHWVMAKEYCPHPHDGPAEEDPRVDMNPEILFEIESPWSPSAVAHPDYTPAPGGEGRHFRAMKEPDWLVENDE
ncbi:hypothetical protein CTA2_12648 [Colletotrichum tanaceti]|nr:hypothetical protein CTA2_12648 [Colletotrichum tanaceti]